jgi:hypothetical protein
MLLVGASILSDGSQHASVCEAAAQNAGESNTNLLVGCVRLCIQNGLCRQDYAAEAKPALGRSFLYEGLLNGMRLIGCAQSFESRDFPLAYCAHWHYTRPHYLTTDDDSARSALRHSAAESRASQT